jgi:RNA 2',3'-cyclic 3'-phosphodiesterase
MGMVSSASVHGRERLRLFCGLCLPDETSERIIAWQEQALSGAEGVRVVPPQNLHITLAFLGSRPVSDVERVAGELHAAAAQAVPYVFEAAGYHETPRVGMLDLRPRYEREPGDAHIVMDNRRLWINLLWRLEQLEIPTRERQVWRPHVTVCRFKERPRLVLTPPDLGAFSPSEAALYHSVLRPDGAQYEVLETVALGG